MRWQGGQDAGDFTMVGKAVFTCGPPEPGIVLGEILGCFFLESWILCLHGVMHLSFFIC